MLACPGCQFRCDDVPSLELHHQIVHVMQNEYECVLCNVLVPRTGRGKSHHTYGHSECLAGHRRHCDALLDGVQEGRGAAPEVDQDGEDGLFMHMAVDEEERAAAAHPVVEAFDAFPQEFFNTYSSRAQPGSFYASMAEGIKQTYDGAAAPSSAPRANEQFKNYDPFPNATIMLLSIFFAVSSIKKKDLNLLLDLLRDQNLTLMICPSRPMF